MPLNIEIKARAGDVSLIEHRVRDLCQQEGVTLHQTDTFFKVPKGRLKMRCDQQGQCELVYYDRRNQHGPVVSHYFRKASNNPQSKMSELAGRYGVKNTITKKRILFTCDNARIHLDDVDGLGRFIEIEVVLMKRGDKQRGKHLARRLMRLIGISESELLPGSYDEMLEESEAQRKCGEDSRSQS